MAIGFDQRTILHGNDGELWIGGDKVMTAISFEAKVTIDNETVEVLGDSGSYARFNGHSGSGTIKRYKTDSSFVKLMHEYISTGIAPEITIIAAVSQPLTGKVERVAFKDITFTEVPLMQMEKKSLIEEELPFDFANSELMEVI